MTSGEQMLEVLWRFAGGWTTCRRCTYLWNKTIWRV